MPCEEYGDTACEVDYPPAEPTDPAVWRIWSRYWASQNIGWDMYDALTDDTLTSQDVDWWKWSFGQIHAASEQRRAAEAKPTSRQ